MPEPQYSHNHIVNPETGFIENPAYPYAFDSVKKTKFLQYYLKNGLDIYQTCDDLGVERKTVIKHYHTDLVFKELFDETEREWYSRIEGISRINAANPKSVVERLAHLNAGSRKGLTLGKYTDEKNSGQTVINLTISESALESLTKRNEIIDVKEQPE